MNDEVVMPNVVAAYSSSFTSYFTYDQSNCLDRLYVVMDRRVTVRYTSPECCAAEFIYVKVSDWL